MAIIETDNQTVKEMKGLHLFHGDISNCSMRVRMTLDEKGVDWVSHHIDLKKKENVTEEYFSINPDGLVPTLIHDGVVHVESNEIIDYLDLTFPDPPLRSEDKKNEMLEWLRLAASIHIPAIKPYVYANKMQKKLQKSEEEEKRYQALQKNEELKEFHSKHAGENEFKSSDLQKSEGILEDVFTKLDAALEGQPWMMGDQFSLADISWIPIHFVLIGCGYPFGRYTNIERWASEVSKRKCFQSGVLAWCADFATV